MHQAYECGAGIMRATLNVRCVPDRVCSVHGDAVDLIERWGFRERLCGSFLAASYPLQHRSAWRYHRGSDKCAGSSRSHA